MAPADAANFGIGVVAEAEHITVAAEALAELRRQRQPLPRRAEQDLGRAKGAGREHDEVGRDLHQRAVEGLAIAVEHFVPDAPLPVQTFDELNVDVREDLGAVVVGVREVVHEGRVLRALVAPGDAVAAQRALALLDADMIDAVGERHVDVGAIELLVHRGGRRVMRGQLRQLRPVLRIRIRLQHGAGVTIRVGQHRGGVVPQGRRPVRILEDPWLRFDRNVGVDQRGAAEAASDDDVDVGIDPEIELCAPRSDVAVGRVNLQVLGRLGNGVRELARLPLGPALEQAHRLPGSRQPRCGNATAITRADHNGRVMVFHRAGGRREALPHWGSPYTEPQ